MIVRSDDAVWTWLQERIFVLDIIQGRYYEFKGIGSFIWQVLDEPREREELVSQILVRYVVSIEQCMADLDRFIDALVTAGLVSETAIKPTDA